MRPAHRARAVVAGAAALAAMAGAAAAQGLPVERYVPAGVALEAAVAAVETCATQGHRVSAAVVDRAGVVRALLRGDGAGSHTADTSARKAYTAATFRVSSAFMMQYAGSTPAAGGMRHIDRVLMVGGALPITVADDVLGAIGVSGAPGVDLDDTCAQAGIDRIRRHLGAP